MNPKCPNLTRRPAGDEIYYWCDLSDHPCMLEYDKEPCEEYEDFLMELEEDA